MLFRWLRSRRRRAVAQRPFPPSWQDVLRRCVRQVEWLSAAEHGRLLEWIAVFLDEKRFEGCRGLVVTDEVRLAIAGQAGIAALGLPDEHFAGLKSVLVYPGDYVVPRSTPLGGGAELEWREARVGETWAGGSMALSWPGVLAGGRLRDGPRSVVIPTSSISRTARSTACRRSPTAGDAGRGSRGRGSAASGSRPRSTRGG